MRQVQVRGCLPALLVLLLVGVLVALAVTASLAVALPVAGALLLLGLVRAVWYRLTGRQPPVTVHTVRIDQAWSGGAPQGPAADEGPVVDALPRPRRESPPPGE